MLLDTQKPACHSGLSGGGPGSYRAGLSYEEFLSPITDCDRFDCGFSSQFPVGPLHRVVAARSRTINDNTNGVVMLELSEFFSRNDDRRHWFSFSVINLAHFIFYSNF